MKCLIIQPMHEAGLQTLRDAGIEPVLCPRPDMPTVARHIGPCAAVITRDAGLSAPAIEVAPLLRVIAVHGAGIDPIDKVAIASRGAVLCTTPGSNAASVAELALGLALAAARLIPAADRAQRRGICGFREKRRFVELSGKTAFIVGWGHTGRSLGAILAGGLGMKILTYSPRMPDTPGAERLENLEEGLAAADLISLHTPLRPQTQGMISAARLALCRPKAILINTARAGLVDEAALAAALASGQLGAVGLDVFSTKAPQGPLGALDTVIFTPHVGGTTEEALHRTATAAAQNVIAALNGQTPAASIDLRPWIQHGNVP